MSSDAVLNNLIEKQMWEELRDPDLLNEIEDSIWESLILKVTNFEFFEKELRKLIHKNVANMIEGIGFVLGPSYVRWQLMDDKNSEDEEVNAGE